MGKTLIAIGSPNSSLVNNSETTLGGAHVSGGNLGDGHSTSFRQAGTISDMAYNNRGGSGTNTVRLNINGSSGNSVVSGTGTGYKTAGVLTDAIAANDVLKYVYTDTGTNPTYSLVKCCFEADAGHITHFIANAAIGGNNDDAASATRFHAFAGLLAGDGSTNESTQQIKARAPGTLKSFQINVLSNARTNDSVFRTRINGGFGNGILTIGAGLTGRFVDDSNEDTIADGDLFNASVTLLTGTEDLRFTTLSCVIESDVEGNGDIVFTPDVRTRAASATAHYFPICGGWSIGITTVEDQVSMTPGFAGTLGNLRCNVGTAYTGSATIKIYKNGVASLTLTLPAATTGWIENTVDTLDFEATDTLSYEIVGGTSGTLTLWEVVVTVSPTPAPAPTWMPRSILY